MPAINPLIVPGDYPPVRHRAGENHRVMILRASSESGMRRRHAGENNELVGETLAAPRAFQFRGFRMQRTGAGQTTSRDHSRIA